jgi:CzcA family heavy metal efflux pump
VWIVRVAITRPYTFIVLALLLLIISPLVILRTSTDIFPNVDIPVIASLWNYQGLSAEEMEERIASPYERSLTTVVTDIDHIESQTVNGRSITKVFFHPGTRPDMAMAQMTAVAQNALHQMPPGSQSPYMIVYSASSVPILQLALSGQGLSEQQLFDYAANFIRTQLATVKGAAIPWPYGGKQRQVMVDLQPALLQSKGLSPADVVNAINSQNLVLPTGTSKIGQYEYDVALNASPETIQELNDLPIKAANNTTIYVHDVAHVRDGFTPQTNIVRRNGQRSTLLSILKIGDTSTLDIVKQVRDMLPKIAATLPPQLKIEPIADQSLFVRAAIKGVVREAIIAACLTAVMILLFIGSWRSTIIIAISIPLSILCSICVLSALGETINIMTLGGLALAVGILVDDATVEIENTQRNLAMDKEIKQAVLDGAQQIAVPAFVSTLCICIVFIPMFFLTGVARYLFVPLAEAVVFAMLASYLLSRTLVPTLAMYLLRPHQQDAEPKPWNLAGRFQRVFERGFEAMRMGYLGMLETCIRRRAVFIPAFLALCASAFLLLPWLGRDFFPVTDAGQFNLHFRAKTGTRIEETARLGDLIETSLRETIPASEISSIIDNIGLPYSSINTAYSNSAPIGTMDADIMVTLNQGHRPSDFYVHELRRRLPHEFPGVTFYFLPADIISQILNFGLPAPIDIQVSGPNLDGNHAFATRLLSQLRTVPGAVDLRVHQLFDLPRIQVNVDRTKAIESGYSPLDVANSLLISLSGSYQTNPTYWLDPKNGVEYSLAAQTPQYDISSFNDLNNVPISSSETRQHPEIMGDVVNTYRRAEMADVTHYNIARAIDIFGNVQDRDLGGVATDIDRIVDKARAKLPRGSQLIVRGQIDTMQSSFRGLLAGLILSIILVYFLIVINFQSWLDPFIIITALPAAMAGIVLFLFVARTTLSVPALMGAIMSVGVATANSILVISFAKDHLHAEGDPIRAALEAGFTRFRPVLMTALAMIIGMVPMAMGLGEGGEQNAPLGRAVIGGLICATVATLFFVPTVFTMLHRRRITADAR